MNKDHRQAAIIEAASVRKHPHFGHWTVFLTFDFKGGGGQNHSSMFPEPHESKRFEWMQATAQSFGVDRLEDIVGKSCHVLFNFDLDCSNDIAGWDVESTNTRMLINRWERDHLGTPPYNGLTQQRMRAQQDIDRAKQKIVDLTKRLTELEDNFEDWENNPPCSPSGETSNRYLLRKADAAIENILGAPVG